MLRLWTKVGQGLWPPFALRSQTSYSCCSGDEKLHQHRQFPLPCERTIWEPSNWWEVQQKICFNSSDRDLLWKCPFVLTQNNLLSLLHIEVLWPNNLPHQRSPSAYCLCLASFFCGFYFLFKSLFHFYPLQRDKVLYPGREFLHKSCSTESGPPSTFSSETGLIMVLNCLKGWTGAFPCVSFKSSSKESHFSLTSLHFVSFFTTIGSQWTSGRERREGKRGMQRTSGAWLRWSCQWPATFLLLLLQKHLRPEIILYYLDVESFTWGFTWDKMGKKYLAQLRSLVHSPFFFPGVDSESTDLLHLPEVSL